MKMRLFFTEAANVVDNQIVDPKKIRNKIIDWEQRVLVRNIGSGKEQTIQTKHISLFDHLLVLEGTDQKLISSLSRNNF